MVGSGGVRTPKMLAAPRRPATWAVVDGIHANTVFGQCCLILAIAASSPNGHWHQVLYQVVAPDQRAAAERDIAMEAERMLRSVALVHGHLELFFSPQRVWCPTLVCRSELAAMPMPLALRAEASRLVRETLGGLTRQLMFPERCAAKRLIAGAAPPLLMREIARHLPPIRLATDASRSSYTRFVSIGWVSDHGDSGGELITHGTKIDVAELLGLVRGIGDIAARHPGRRVLVFCDSKLAIRALRKAGRRQGIVEPGVGRLLEEGVVRVRWVRAHRGNPLNEAAHRLAVHARRCVEFDVPQAHQKRVRDQILADLWGQLAARGDASAG